MVLPYTDLFPNMPVRKSDPVAYNMSISTVRGVCADLTVYWVFPKSGYFVFLVENKRESMCRVPIYPFSTYQLESK